MKILDKNNNYCKVFGFYRLAGEDYFYALYKNDSFLSAFRKNEVKIVDYNFYGRWVFYKGGIFHWALIEHSLLDGVIERDKDACNRFLEIIASEGHIPYDFPKI